MLQCCNVSQELDFKEIETNMMKITHDRNCFRSLNKSSWFLLDIFPFELKLNLTLFNKVQKTLTVPDYS